jgi:hypothetical protein
MPHRLQTSSGQSSAAGPARHRSVGVVFGLLEVAQVFIVHVVVLHHPARRPAPPAPPAGPTARHHLPPPPPPSARAGHPMGTQIGDSPAGTASRRPRATRRSCRQASLPCGAGEDSSVADRADWSRRPGPETSTRSRRGLDSDSSQGPRSRGNSSLPNSGTSLPNSGKFEPSKFWDEDSRWIRRTLGGLGGPGGMQRAPSTAPWTAPRGGLANLLRVAIRRSDASRGDEWGIKPGSARRPWPLQAPRVTRAIAPHRPARTVRPGGTAMTCARIQVTREKLQRAETDIVH